MGHAVFSIPQQLRYPETRRHSSLCSHVRLFQLQSVLPATVSTADERGGVLRHRHPHMILPRKLTRCWGARDAPSRPRTCHPLHLVVATPSLQRICLVAGFHTPQADRHGKFRLAVQARFRLAGTRSKPWT